MFTGIIEALGRVAELTPQGAGAHLRVSAPRALLDTLKPGDSIAVSGCCLTITTVEEDPAGENEAMFAADLAEETLLRTGFGRIGAGDAVNLERPLRAGDLLSGHLVQGHVEGVGTLLGLDPVAHAGGEAGAGGWWLRIRVPADLLPYIVWKGSLTIEGISLTVAQLEDDVAGIAIIPFTWHHTNLRTLASGSIINLETDPLARHVERLLQTRFAAALPETAAAQSGPAANLTVGKLLEQGF